MTIKRHNPAKILSAAVEHGDTVYLAGQVAQDVSRDVKGQTEDILGQIDALLAKCGSSKSKILYATIWVADIRHRDAVNVAWSAWADPKNLPARACIEAKLADARMQVEIAVIAAK